MSRLPDGLYDQILTSALTQRLNELHTSGRYTALPILHSRSEEQLGAAFTEQIQKILRELSDRQSAATDEERVKKQVDILNEFLLIIRERYPALRSVDEPNLVDTFSIPPGRLVSVHERRPELIGPETSVRSPWLFSATKGAPNLLSELRHELNSSDRVDILMSFITVSGLRRIRDILQAVTACDGNGQARTRLRVLTTTYIGATEANAVDELARLPWCEVKISLDGRRSRLHAKAWIFERDSGYGSAYVGSANLTQAALAGGLEWTVKFTERGQFQMFQQAQAQFETLWNDPEFTHYHPDLDGHRPALLAALGREGAGQRPSNENTALSFFELSPKNYQLEMLERLATERQHGRKRNLVVAATGTGKTMVAAFDYSRQCRGQGGRPRLLFLAHRVEILRQAQRAYREVLRDPSFGQILGGGHQFDSPDYLFATIDSFRAQALLQSIGADYWHTVVFDECHRMAAASFDQVATSIQPAIMLGLTATPERTDGRPISSYFNMRPDGRPAVELRLWHALDHQLLTPFEYFACDDDTDLRAIPWQAAGESAALDSLLGNNERRARLVIDEWQRLCADPSQSRAIAFCVSVNHARFMAEQFLKAGIPALCVTGQTPQEEREGAYQALTTGRVCVLVTVDLFNEGIDIPCVDTLLLLRPTQSALLFQQQIGRGLRLSPGKETCLILDFVGQHGADFRFDQLLGQITGLSRRQLIDGLENGFAELPTGCYLHLQQRTREQVLLNLRNAIRQSWRRLAGELQAYSAGRAGKEVQLAEFLYHQDVGLSEIYREHPTKSGWTALKRDAGLVAMDVGPDEEYMGRRFASLLHVNDPRQLEIMRKQSAARGNVSDDEVRFQMLAHQVFPNRTWIGPGERFIACLDANPNSASELRELAGVLADETLPEPSSIPGLEFAPLCLHGRYRLNEILTAIQFHDAAARPPFFEGVLRLYERSAELMFVTLDKQSGYHNSIAYHDYAISRSLFHWQSQNSASPATAAGRRYVESKGENPNGWQFFLFVRGCKDEPYLACGRVRLVSWHDERPMNITWKLDSPLPASAFSRFSVLRAPN